jgi:hypothetical protein
VDNAHRLRGRLLLSVGELDTNVDPASTLQVAAALIRANKDFDFIVLPGQGHSAGGAYGERKRFDFFVRHLRNVNPPAWNTIDPPPTRTDALDDAHAAMHAMEPVDPTTIDPFWQQPR